MWLILVAFCTTIGALFGSWLFGLAVGLGLVLAISLAPTKPY